MNSKSKKQMVVLIALLGLLSLSIFSQMTIGIRPIATSPGSVAHLQHTAEPSQSNEVVQVHLLETSPQELSRVKRNIFQFESKARGPQVQAPDLQIPQSQPLLPQTPLLFDVHYLGFYYEKDTGLKLAAIVNGGKIYVGRVGQTLGGKYELLEIAADYVILRLTVDGKVLRIPLGKGSPNVVNQAELKGDRGKE
jgi:hypothetical protein